LMQETFKLLRAQIGMTFCYKPVARILQTRCKTGSTDKATRKKRVIEVECYLRGSKTVDSGTYE
jgi:uncharacterized protein YjhX (UPF0386 family)